MTRAATIAGRLHGDYLQRERLDDFQALLRTALEHGYRTMPLSVFADLTAAGPLRAGDRILLLRHDVDTDVRRARRMWEMERQLGVVGSYFFRRSTWDIAFMRDLARAGCDVGYHYEELATVVKERGAASAAEARALLGAARDRLRMTVPELRARTGLALDVFAAHGDFANRAVGVSNVELLSDPALREELGVRLEAYDVESDVSARSSDGVPPRGWQPENPMRAILRGETVVAVLLHPRSWGGAPTVNARADLVRLREGCVYRLRRARHRR
ncbi:MAG: hypothetical protein ACXVFN_04745 [Solirubrobacteraceae bacterium]